MVGRETQEALVEAYKLDEQHPVVMPDGSIAYNHVSTLDEPKIVHLTSNPSRSSTELKWAAGPQCATDKTRVRITLDMDIAEVARWSKWHDDNGGSQRWKQSLQRTGGDYASWFVCEHEIPRDKWVEVVDLDTGRVLWRRPDLNAPVTKDDVDKAVALAHWAGHQNSRIVVLNDKCMAEFFKYAMVQDVPDRDISPAEMEDYFFVFLSPQAMGMKEADNRAVLACGFKFMFEEGAWCTDVCNVVTNDLGELCTQRWSDMILHTADRCKLVVGGRLRPTVYGRMYFDLKSFLATPCAHSERRKSPGTIQLPGSSKTKKAKKESDVSVIVYRRPEKVIASRMKAEGRKLDHAVAVSGHYRNQWYRSTGTHRQIFIAEHRRGPELDAPAPKQKIRVIKAVR
ncbi:MAG: hypothetical protein JSS66_06050 [Armatimonadetes bacterium]|nr:hypothetical protein [Armatimonadota bacterium]